MAVNVNPNQTTLHGVGDGAKGFSGNRQMRIVFNTADAPGATCELGEASAPTSVHLNMVDDNGEILTDSAKTMVCRNKGPNDLPTAKRKVFWEGPKNCENSAIPTGGKATNGDITATVSIAGQPDYVEVLNIKCFAD